MHETQLPYPCALACEVELQGVLASENFHHQFQLPPELHAVDTCRSASKS